MSILGCFSVCMCLTSVLFYFILGHLLQNGDEERVLSEDEQRELQVVAGRGASGASASRLIRHRHEDWGLGLGALGYGGLGVVLVL